MYTVTSVAFARVRLITDLTYYPVRAYGLPAYVVMPAVCRSRIEDYTGDEGRACEACIETAPGDLPFIILCVPACALRTF